MAFVRGLGIVPGDVWVGKGRQGAKVVIVGLDPDTAEVFYSLMPVVPGRLLSRMTIAVFPRIMERAGD